MFAYEIGYYSHEESHYIQLMHEERFSAEQLETMVLACIPDSVERVWDNSLDPDIADLDDDYDKYYGAERAQIEAAKFRLRIDFTDLMRGVYDHDKESYVASLTGLLRERFGFTPFAFEATYIRWGWGDLVAGDWDYDDPDKDARANLVATVRASLTEYVARHPEVKERFGIEDIDSFIQKLNEGRGNGEEEPTNDGL